MKVIRAPWIRCRADEAGAHLYDMEWKRIAFAVLAYSEEEARSWWSALDDSDRGELLGLEQRGSADQFSLF